ncbi:MAG TPA: type 2 lanthipeptide synthetase LanM family protein [Jatrophihabitans sp.]|nr:type 2 lanthipeptide synthetase LanM family protein [Jatrophihabitans sp.]
MFRPVLQPLLTATERVLADKLAGRPLAAGVSRAARQCLPELTDRLTGIIIRTMLADLGRRTAADPDLDPTGRRHLDRLLEQYSGKRGLARLLLSYPLLARLLAIQCLNHVDAVAELAARLSADLPAITTQLCRGGPAGPVTSFELAAGDRHRGGRTVATVRFGDGQQVVYKPRCGAIAIHLRPLFAWFGQQLPELAPRLPMTLPRAGYCWEEHIEALPCTDLSAVQRFYRREGALLALLHVLGSTDMHCENIIAHGDEPVIVDLETVFHTQPATIEQGNPAEAALAESVMRVGMLPLMLEGEFGQLDISGCGGGDRADTPLAVPVVEALGTDAMRLCRRPVPTSSSPNRPKLNGRPMGPDDFLAELIAGFRSGYDVIRSGADRLRQLASAGADDEVRLVIRETYLYAALLAESTHPDLLTDPETRDAFLRRIARLRPVPQLEQLLDAEVADLWNHDVPMLLTRPASRVITPANGIGSGTAPESALERLTGLLGRLGARHQRDQKWIIQAAFATRAPSIQHLARPSRELTGTEDVDPGRLIAEACAIADELCAAAQYRGERVGWLGVEPADGRHWSLAPLGAGLGDGYLGVALFLVALARQTGIPRYLDLATRVLLDLPDLITRCLNDELAAVQIGGGAMDGLGGIAWAVAQLTRAPDGTAGLLPDQLLADVLTLCQRLVSYRQERSDHQPAVDDGDVAGGLAGLVITMDSLARSGLPNTITDTSRQLADAAAGLLPPIDPDAAAGGALHGPTGTAWARRVAGSADRSPARPPAGAADLSWCSGLSGQLALETAARPDLVRALADPPPLVHHGVCHGETGTLEALLVLSQRGDRRASQGLRRRSAALLGALTATGPRCGTPGQISTPGYLHGLAGIGYGLLRLADPSAVPSILLFEPLPVVPSAEGKPHVTAL